jgi:surface antigen
MLPRHLRTTTALVLVAGMAAAPLYGCKSVEEETGISQTAQGGALGGGAFGGVVAALAGASPAWIAASVILGGVTGGLIGDYLGKEDAEQHAQTNLNALETLGPGQTAQWSDQQSGNYGSTTVNNVWRQADGTVCKQYTESIHTSQKSVSQPGTACKAPNGTWTQQHA